MRNFAFRVGKARIRDANASPGFVNTVTRDLEPLVPDLSDTRSRLAALAARDMAFHHKMLGNREGARASLLAAFRLDPACLMRDRGMQFEFLAAFLGESAAKLVRASLRRGAQTRPL